MYRRQASDPRVEDLDAKFVSTFLKHLEHDRHNSARTRNNRLSAIHAFFGYASVNEPALANHCQRVLAIPPKRAIGSIRKPAQIDRLLPPSGSGQDQSGG